LDGNWFLRAYDSYGNKIGSKDNAEGKIFIESQSWCAMSKVGFADEMVKKALNSVKTFWIHLMESF
jgi:cellobiose phosphorylase